VNTVDHRDLRDVQLNRRERGNRTFQIISEKFVSGS
jgi:hypothetical protein